MNRNVLVAAAWPYVNGPLHLGHVAALLPADILARYFRAVGDNVLFVSGSDCHGTPILVTAERQKSTPTKVAERYHQLIIKTLIHGLGFSYDFYARTMDSFHQLEAQKLFQAIYDAGALQPHTAQQAFCPTCQRFLPDRYIGGTCPHEGCGHEDARGDQCDTCGKIHEPHELVNPHCTTCGCVPEWRETTHLYFEFGPFVENLKLLAYKGQGIWRDNAARQTMSTLEAGLTRRPVTRDLSWGIPVPIEGFTDKCMYVWFEAVMGYLTCSKRVASQTADPQNWRQWWKSPEAIHYYVHGKDNIPFHTLIWPAMLMTLGLHLPDHIISSEYLNFGGSKFSKSQSVGITIPEVLEHFPPDAVRYYLAFNGPENKDTNFSWEDFVSVVNNTLIGKVGNFWHRTLTFIYKNGGQVPEPPPLSVESTNVLTAITLTGAELKERIEAGSFRTALQRLMEFADLANRYFHDREPWKHNQPTLDEHGRETLFVSIQLVEALRCFLSPFTPHICAKVAGFYGADTSTWEPPLVSAYTQIQEPQVVMSTLLLPKITTNQP